MQTAAGSTALVSAPNFLLNLNAHAALDKQNNDNILVVVQLSGGNDGLNTVVPYGDDSYNKNRFTLRIAKQQVLKLNNYIGLHPAMTGMKELYDEGKLAILQGIGYPNPNRSHFASMDIWHTARLDAPEDTNPARRTGWIGRYLDGALSGKGLDVPALHLGSDRQPLAVVGQDVRVPSVQSLEGFKFQTGGDQKLAKAVKAANTVARPASNDLLNFMHRSTVTAMDSSKQVQDATRNYSTPVKYPGSGLAKKLKTVAQLIDAGLTTRVYYVTLGGFDTHANQQQAHFGLLKQLSDAVNAFMKDITHHGHNKRVLLMSFSEFGRRIKENASRGTDHGAAAPMFILGDPARSGIIGAHPSLTNTQQGDLKEHTDFRQVYASVLDEWLRFDSRKVLGRKFTRLDVLDT